MQHISRKSLRGAATLAFALGLTAACTTTQMGGAEEGEARLATMLEGKTAGEPQSCIPAFLDNRLRIIDETAVVYDAGDTIYVARPDNPRSLDSRDILVIERTGSQLCKQDVVRTIDRTQGYTTGVVFLGDFVPYE
ncbi:hypothetical protein [Aurantiacibacter poecillastricola]|uniref:hypothetical protein n=1 Tax=Aurantiacibacter poecillastricola TaxID=3064385 RepID=UPI00273D4075|nr:hypothetical protein [Aurantiacibacter sp. 219JJ12-13]MDP5261784.1 hypothetical protein [Aurantiacibacter sp. 219JJ12-13]